MREIRVLNDAWRVRREGGPDCPIELPADGVDAVVPGCVHLDLIRLGLLTHPDLGDGEAEQAWIGRTDWTWRRPLGPADRIGADEDADAVCEIVLDSIDTVGEVRLGEEVLGHVENQFHAHRYRIPAEAFAAHRVLEVALRGPVAELERRVERYGDRPVNADGDWGVYSYLRKAACSFGWDWGPKCPSLGLPGDVRLERWRDARIDAVRPLVTTCNDRLAILEVLVDVVRDEATSEDGELRATARLEAPDGRVFEAEGVADPEADHVRILLEVPDPQRWWPRGRGEQPLHDLEIDLRRDETVLDHDRRRVGLRIIALDTGRDPEGSRFRIVVNGEPMFCRGANWIPEGLFPGTAADELVIARIEQAVEANFDMLRVWGGGVYESQAFYDACDEWGIMVWQDFMFACATYPEEAPYPELIEREANFQIRRLAAHASIVLWCGGNENVLAWRNWGWKERMDPARSWGRHYFTELLPRIAATLDPSRPFLPDSPWSGSVDADPNDPDHGDRHTWDLKLEDVREMIPRFVSEFGHQAPPARRTMETAIGREPFAGESPEAMAAFAGRQRGWGGDQAQYDRWMDDWFLPPSDLDGRIWRMQLLQARATTFTYEWLRLHSNRCGGALVWQLNDAWTGHSWSLVDVAGRPKPAWWSARAACAPRLLAFSVGEAGIEIAAVNDTDETWGGGVSSGGVRIRRVDMAGVDLDAAALELAVPPRGTRAVALLPDLVIPADPSMELLVAELGGHRAFWFYGKDAWLSLPSPAFDLRIERAASNVFEVEITARTILRDLHLDEGALGEDVRVDENLRCLLPGEVANMRIRGVSSLREDDLRRSGVLRTANECGPSGASR